MSAPRTAARRADRSAPLAPDLDAAGDFLDQWVGLTGAPHVTLVSIVPDGAIKGRTFTWPDHRAEALRWIAAKNADANIYFAVNLARPVHKKPTKADVEQLNAAHADVDPIKGVEFAAERERLENLAHELAARAMPPTFIIDSGGGIQAFYVAAEGCPVEPDEFVREVEDYNHRLHCALGSGDPTWNVDRIMRVPGTVNWPDRRKRDAGRTPAMARVLHAAGAAYPWRDIAAAIAQLEDEPLEHAAVITRRPHARPNGAGLPPWPSEEQMTALFENHPEIAAVWDQSTFWPPLDLSPSGWDHRFASALAHIGAEPGLIGSFLRAYRQHHEPSKDKHNRADYIWRTVARATRYRAEPDDDPELEDDGPPFEARPNGQQQTAGSAKGTFNTGVKPGADWPEPGVLGAPPPAPQFPTELLPDNLRRWVEQQAESMGLPTCVLAVPGLVMAAGAIGRSAILQVKKNDPSWAERPAIWGALIMPKGTLKSPALREMMGPLHQAEAHQRARWKEQVKEWKKRQEYTRQTKLKPKDDDPKPPEPKIVVTNATTKALADAMVESHGLTMVQDELSSLLLNMSRYTNGSDRQFYLAAHSGGPYAVDRVIRGRQIVPDMYMSVIGGIQPKVAKRLLAAAAGAEDDGFFERFGLLAYPDPIPWTGVRDVPPDRTWRHLTAQAVDRLANYAWGTELYGQDRGDALMHFDDAAQAMFLAWYDLHQREHVRAPGAEDRPDHGFMCKGPGLALRLAITIHLLRWTGGEVDPRIIDPCSLDCAVGIFDRFCRPMYERVTAAFGEVVAHDAARRVADLIKRKKLDKIRVGEVTKMHWSGMRERAPIIAAFEALEDVDWLRRPQHTAPGARGGRPSDSWIVNPKVHQ